MSARSFLTLKHNKINVFEVFTFVVKCFLCALTFSNKYAVSFEEVDQLWVLHQKEELDPLFYLTWDKRGGKQLWRSKYPKNRSVSPNNTTNILPLCSYHVGLRMLIISWVEICNFEMNLRRGFIMSWTT